MKQYSAYEAYVYSEGIMSDESIMWVKASEAEAKIKKLEEHGAIDKDFILQYQKQVKELEADIKDFEEYQKKYYSKLAKAEERLFEIKEIWIGSDGVKGVPKYAQEAYALHLCKKMYSVAVSYFNEEK